MEYDLGESIHIFVLAEFFFADLEMNSQTCCTSYLPVRSYDLGYRSHEIPIHPEERVHELMNSNLSPILPLKHYLILFSPVSILISISLPSLFNTARNPGGKKIP